MLSPNDFAGTLMTMANDTIPRQLNVGCGHDIRLGWVNLDMASLPGVDIVQDLDKVPWPFLDNAFDEIVMINVLEHLGDTIRIMEELHRICADGAKVTIRVPYWNSPDAITDPTHKAVFNQHTFEFFDPGTRHGRERAYYTSARFRIRKQTYFSRLAPGLPYLRVSWSVPRLLLGFLAVFLGGIIWVVEVQLEAIKGS